MQQTTKLTALAIICGCFVAVSMIAMLTKGVCLGLQDQIGSILAYYLMNDYHLTLRGQAALEFLQHLSVVILGLISFCAVLNAGSNSLALLKQQQYQCCCPKQYHLGQQVLRRRRYKPYTLFEHCRSKSIQRVCIIVAKAVGLSTSTLILLLFIPSASGITLPTLIIQNCDRFIYQSLSLYLKLAPWFNLYASKCLRSSDRVVLLDNNISGAKYPNIY